MDVRLVFALTLLQPVVVEPALLAQVPTGRSYAVQERAGSIPLREAAEAPRLSGSVTLRRTRAPLDEVLREIARQAGLGISFGEQLPRSDTRVSIDVAGLRAADALERAVRGTSWTLLYAPDGQLVVVQRAAAREGSIGGRVTAARSGQPIASATVLVQGTQLGATTDADGNYRIAGVPAGVRTVIARRIGYSATTRTVSVADDATATLDIGLEPAASDLQAVVVTGTAGNQTRVAQAAVVATIDAADLVVKAPVNSVSDLLTSRTPGITITQGSGTLGASLAHQHPRRVVHLALQRAARLHRRRAHAVGGLAQCVLNLGGQQRQRAQRPQSRRHRVHRGGEGPGGGDAVRRRRLGRRDPDHHEEGQHRRRAAFRRRSPPSTTRSTRTSRRARSTARCTAAQVAATSTSALCRGQAVGTVVTDN